MHYFDLILLTFCKALSILISGEEMGSEREPGQHHIEPVTGGKAETLLQVGMTLSTWHGLARGLRGELKVSVTSAGVKQQEQGAAGSTRKEWR